MTKRHKIETESVILFIIAAGVGVAFSFYYGNKPQLATRMYIPVMQTNANSLPILTATPTPLIPKPIITSQISPDGTRQLTMTLITNKDLTKTYTFVTANADDSNQQTIYNNPNTSDAMSIPFNTWSPDNTYVFITQGTETLVMRADGNQLTNTEANVNITTLFTAKNTGNVYQETTGWASNTLLIINTKVQDGSKGPSYWLEVPSKAIIQLSTQF